MVSQHKRNEADLVKTDNTMLQDVFSLLLKIAAVAVIGILLFTFLFGAYQNREVAMDPAVKDGDVVVFYRLEKRYAASDLLVLEYQGKMQTRRVIALAGDMVDITEDGLLINGARQIEPGIYEETQAYADGIRFPVTVGEGEVFVLGDSREHAADSRMYGLVKIEDTLGKVMMIIRRRGM